MAIPFVGPVLDLMHISLFEVTAAKVFVVRCFINVRDARKFHVFAKAFNERSGRSTEHDDGLGAIVREFEVFKKLNESS